MEISAYGGVIKIGSNTEQKTLPKILPTQEIKYVPFFQAFCRLYLDLSQTTHPASQFP